MRKENLKSGVKGKAMYVFKEQKDSKACVEKIEFLYFSWSIGK